MTNLCPLCFLCIDESEMMGCLTQSLEWVKKDSGVGKISLAAVEQDLDSKIDGSL